MAFVVYVLGCNLKIVRRLEQLKNTFFIDDEWITTSTSKLVLVPVNLDECIGAYLSTLPSDVRELLGTDASVLRAIRCATSEWDFYDRLTLGGVGLRNVGDHLKNLYAPKHLLLTNAGVSPGIPAVKFDLECRVSTSSIYACVERK